MAIRSKCEGVYGKHFQTVRFAMTPKNKEFYFVVRIKYIIDKNRLKVD